jgi:hypothetical protein
LWAFADSLLPDELAVERGSLLGARSTWRRQSKPALCPREPPNWTIMPVTDRPQCPQSSTTPRGGGIRLAEALWITILVWFSASAVREIVESIVAQVLVAAILIAEMWQFRGRGFGRVTPYAVVFFTLTYAVYIYHGVLSGYYQSIAWASPYYHWLLGR